MLTKSKPEEADRLIQLAQEDVNQRWAIYEALAAHAEALGVKTPPPAAPAV
jgi:hypothetical protein